MTARLSSTRPAPLLRPESLRDLQLTVAGHVPRKTDWIHRRFEVMAVGLVVAGAGTYQVNRGPVLAIGPGALFAVYPGAIFHYGPAAGSTWDEYHVGCAGPGVQRWLRAGWFWMDGSVRHLGQLGPVIEIFRELLACRQRAGAGDSDRSALLAERLLMEMYHAWRAPGSAAVSPRAVDEALAYCRRHATEPIRFHELARRFALSYSALRQQIRQRTGEPPARYLNLLRCDLARSLLSDTDLPIKVVAARVGMPDPYTFSRTFKRCVGVSPAAYRRQVTMLRGPASGV